MKVHDFMCFLSDYVCAVSMSEQRLNHPLNEMHVQETSLDTKQNNSQFPVTLTCSPGLPVSPVAPWGPGRPCTRQKGRSFWVNKWNCDRAQKYINKIKDRNQAAETHSNPTWNPGGPAGPCSPFSPAGP